MSERTANKMTVSLKFTPKPYLISNMFFIFPVNIAKNPVFSKTKKRRSSEKAVGEKR